MSVDMGQLIRNLESGDLETRRFAAEELAQAQHLSKEAEDALTRHVSCKAEASEDVREWCVYAIGQRRITTAKDALVSALKKDSVKDVRIMASRALGSIGDQTSARVLKERLRVCTDAVEKKHICLAMIDGTKRPLGGNAFSRALKECIAMKEIIPDEVKLRVADALKPSRPDRGRRQSPEPPRLPFQDEPIEVVLPKPNPHTILKTDVTRTLTGPVSRYVRDQKLRAAAIEDRLAVCQLCGRKPFKTRKGEDYAEVHHIKSVSAGGPDTPENLLVVCPTCHKKLHLTDAKAAYDVERRMFVAIEIYGKRIPIRWNSVES